MSISVVVLDPIDSGRAGRMRALLPEGWTLSHATGRGDDAMMAVIAEADYAIAGQVPVSGQVLRAARRLKLLHKWGVGVDNIDVATAHALGIAVARTTGSNAVPVAEFAVGLMIATMRGIATGHARLKQGEWRGFGPAPDSYTLYGKTVGIIGFGAIGQALARVLRGFDCEILYLKRTPLPQEQELALGARFAPLPELLSRSDVVSLNCPLTPETEGLIDAAALAAMKPTAVLVNVARGGVVVEEDLAAALRQRQILGAAMDVFATEPLPADSPLLGIDSLVVTPHVASTAVDTFEPTVRRMFDNMLRNSRGEPVRTGDEVVFP